MKVVILAGGFGSRLSEETVLRPWLFRVSVRLSVTSMESNLWS